jgi:4-amino-4-deoxy-L-arabinose transferase-like glycosyltransferase
MTPLPGAEPATDSTRRPGTLWLAALALAMGAALAARIVLARQAQHPGHADDAFYYDVARSLTAGRGFEIDYIWHYLAPPATVTHPANDYWLPFPSVAMAVSLRLLGDSVFAALLPGILFGVGLAPLLYWGARHRGESHLIAFSAALLALVEPTLVGASLESNSTIYYTVLVALSLLVADAGTGRPWLLLLAAVAAGLASLARQDGFLLLVLLGFLIWRAGGPWPVRARRVLVAAAAYVVTLAPLLALNYASFGRVVAPGHARLLFATRFEEGLYSYSQWPNWSTYLQWGFPNILLSKLGAAIANFEGIWEQMGWLAALSLLAMLAGALGPDRAVWWSRERPFVVFVALLLGFHTLVTTFTAGSGFLNSSPAIVPGCLLIVAGALARLLRRPPLTLLAVAILTAALAARAFTEAREVIEARNRLVQPLAHVKALIERDAMTPPAEVVVMARVPWELHWSTGYKAIQIPADDLPTILEVARRYRANYLLLPAPRPALERLYRDERSDGRFRFVGAVPHASPDLGRYSPLKLFWIGPASATAGG